MKKVLRFLGILVLVLVVGFLIICAIAPKEATIERSTSIKGSKKEVMDQFVYFKNWKNWSPFFEMDTAMVVKIEGTDGQPGSTYHWLGESSGEGIMTHRDVADDKMTIDMQFIKPFEAKPTSWFKAEDEGNGMTKVTWGYHDNYGFMMAGGMKVMGMFGMGLEKSFDRGLELMKKHVESNPQAEANAVSTEGWDIKETQFPGHTYAGIRKTVAFNAMDQFFMNSYGSVSKTLGDGIQGPASALVYKWDETKHEADIAAVFPVADEKAAKGATVFEVPASKAYMMTYTGPYSGIPGAHEAMGKHLMSKNAEPGLVVEEYIKNDQNEKDSTKWVTNIIYLVK